MISEFRWFSLTTLTALTSGAIWFYLFFFRGSFWRLGAFDDSHATLPARQVLPCVQVVVPARNEASTIAKTIASLLNQTYPGVFSITVVDDHSSDRTAEIAHYASAKSPVENRVTILSAPPPTVGWTGKLWALQQGVSFRNLAVTTAYAQPVFFWFTDADIEHAPDTLRRLVARAERGGFDLVSLMVLLRSRTFPEKLLIPPFVYFFLQLYPPRWIADARAHTAGAAGGCLLIRREALERIGGLHAIRTAVIDDCALARAVKKTDGRIWMGVTRSSISLRDYPHFAEIRDMIARTAFTQLRYSTVLLLFTIVVLLVTYVAPVALLFAADPLPRALGALAWLLMSLSFFGTVRYYRLSATWSPLLPAVALFYAYATLLSAFRFWQGRGGQWKGRAQAPSPSSPT